MKSMTLYNIANEYQQIFNELYDSETGEINPEVQARLDALEPMGEKKCVAIVSFMKNIEAQKQAIKFALSEMESRQEKIEKELNRWDNYLKTNMEKMGISEVSCPYFTIKLKKNPYSTEILDQTQVPTEYLRFKQVIKDTVTVDKDKVKKDFIDNGVLVPGTLVKQNLKLEILTDRI